MGTAITVECAHWRAVFLHATNSFNLKDCFLFLKTFTHDLDRAILCSQYIALPNQSVLGILLFEMTLHQSCYKIGVKCVNLHWFQTFFTLFVSQNSVWQICSLVIVDRKNFTAQFYHLQMENPFLQFINFVHPLNGEKGIPTFPLAVHGSISDRHATSADVISWLALVIYVHIL